MKTSGKYCVCYDYAKKVLIFFKISTPYYN